MGAAAASPTIVVGVDGSPHALAALRWALVEARAHGAVVRAVAVWHMPTVAYEVPFQMDELERDLRDEAAATLDKALAAAADAAGDLVVERAVREGNPGKVLVDESDGAWQLVVGSRGHGSLGELILGSVSHHCCRHAHCPVTVIPRAAEPPPS